VCERRGRLDPVNVETAAGPRSTVGAPTETSLRFGSQPRDERLGCHQLCTTDFTQARASGRLRRRWLDAEACAQAGPRPSRSPGSDIPRPGTLVTSYPQPTRRGQQVVHRARNPRAVQDHLTMQPIRGSRSQAALRGTKHAPANRRPRGTQSSCVRLSCANCAVLRGATGPVAAGTR
jgi:hypothetical protein